MILKISCLYLFKILLCIRFFNMATKKESAIFHSLMNSRHPSYGSLLLPPHFPLTLIISDKPQQKWTSFISIHFSSHPCWIWACRPHALPQLQDMTEWKMQGNWSPLVLFLNTYDVRESVRTLESREKEGIFFSFVLKTGFLLFVPKTKISSGWGRVGCC